MSKEGRKLDSFIANYNPSKPGTYISLNEYVVITEEFKQIIERE